MKTEKIKTFITLFALFGTTNALISNFELDGNAIVNDPLKKDWSNVSGGVIFTGILDDPAPVSTFTTGGSKDTNDISRWRHRDSSVPDKDDLTNAYAFGEQFEDNLYIYFGTDRFSNDGDAAIGFWFFQDTVDLLNNGKFTGKHQDGDLLVISNYGSTQDIQVYRWQSGSLVLELSDNSAECDDSKNQTVCAITNSAPTPSPWSYTAKTGERDQFPQYSFLEGGLNLRDIFDGDTVPCFTSFMVVSRSSSSITGQLKDFILGSFDICDLSLSVKCNDINFNQERNGLIYNYYIVVNNTGFGTIYDVNLYYDNRVVTSYSQLESGDTYMYFGTFNSSDLNETTSNVRVRGSKVKAPTSESDYLDSVFQGVQCPFIMLNPGLGLNGSCFVGLVTESNRLSVQVNYSGQVCNTGDIQMERVLVTNTQTSEEVDLGTLAYRGCKSYMSNFYPTIKDGYNNTVWVSGISTLGSYNVSDSTSFNCLLC